MAFARGKFVLARSTGILHFGYSRCRGATVPESGFRFGVARCLVYVENNRENFRLAQPPISVNHIAVSIDSSRVDNFRKVLLVLIEILKNVYNLFNFGAGKKTAPIQS